MRLTSISIIQTPILIDTNWQSSPIWVGHTEHFSISLEFSGVPEGSFSIQYSNDGAEPTYNKIPTGFATVEGSTQNVDEAGTHGWNVQNVGYRWVRIIWTHSMGTGYLDRALFHGKGV